MTDWGVVKITETKRFSASAVARIPIRDSNCVNQIESVPQRIQGKTTR